MDDWIRTFMLCHAVTGMGVWLIQWPDGKSLHEQPALTVTMFSLVREALSSHMEKELNTRG